MPRQVDHDARRRAACEAAAHIAAESGFGEVTIRNVAARAGASTSVVTHYLRDRDELLRSTVRQELTARQAEFEGAVGVLPGAAALRAVLEHAVLGPTDRSHRLWLAMVVGAHSEPVLRVELDAFNEWWSQLLRGLVRELDLPDADRHVLLDALDVVVDGLVVTGFEGRTTWSTSRRRHVLDLLLEPLLPPPGEQRAPALSRPARPRP